MSNPLQLARDFWLAVCRRPKVNMSFMRALTVLTVLAAAGLGCARLSAAERDGVALAIIYDTSGSMAEPVPDRAGHTAPKYLIADRALIAVARQIHCFITNNAAASLPRPIHVGLYVFQGEGAREAVKFGSFNETALRDWATNFRTPRGKTPLGAALRNASQAVLDSPFSRKHVLVITDGMNTAGPSPAAVLPGLKRRAEDQHTTLSVHFVAFDISAKVFDPLKKLGATVVSASNENQLNAQLQFILERKILLEEEEKK
jgi:von Willebrand factor type A domain